jgi:aminobenzoyl-glutamate transport protein
MAEKRSLVLRFLDATERIGNRTRSRCSCIFAILVVVVSWIAATANVSAVHPGTGETISAVNLLSAEGSAAC